MIRKLPKYLTEAQMIALVRAPNVLAPAGLRDRALLSMLCATGLRASEICGLMPGDVMPDLVFVRAGKYGHQRWVPISPQAHRALGAYLLRHPAEPGVPLFRTGPGRGLTRRRLHKIVDRYCLALKLPRGVHTLRHSAATRWLNAGINLQFVRAMLGHARLATTAVYLGVATNALVAEYRRCLLAVPGPTGALAAAGGDR